MPLIICSDCGAQISELAPACPRCGRPQRTATAGAQSSNAMPTEQILFQDNLVTVTTVRAIVRQNTTYAMSNLTSVREFVEPRPRGALWLGILMLLIGWSFTATNARTLGICVILLAILAFYIFLRTKPKHWVCIGTAGAETNAIWSRDPKWTGAVVAAINGALVARG